MRVAYVLGLAHSGTTIMDRILSCFPRTVGLGEVDHIWTRASRSSYEGGACPCGQAPTSCPFWKDVLGKTYSREDEFIREVVRTARSQGYNWMVDSSKSLAGLVHYSSLLKDGEVDELAILRILRDPRGWVHSMMRRNDIARDDVSAIRGLFYRWMLTSIRFDRGAHRPGSETVYVWHDKLVLAREENLLGKVLGFEPVEGGLALSEANQHAIAGNKFVFSERRSSISYDARWMENKFIEDAYADLPILRNYYHELQKLHLRKGGILSGLPNTEPAKALLQTAISTGDFAAVDEAISAYRFTAIVND